MTEDKIAAEVVESEFNRFTDEMDLDVDTGGMDSEDMTAFNKHKNRILKAMKGGHLVINETGEAVYTPHNPRSKAKDPLTFHERTGASLMASDGKKKGHDVAKTYAVMGDMCKVHPGILSGLAGVDIKTCEAIYTLLMD